MLRRRGSFAVALLALSLAACRPDTGSEASFPRLEAATEAIQRLLEHEMEIKQLPAVSIALVSDQGLLWTRGFGWADAETQRPATADTVYRVGSVSKLFTDLAVMQQVERGTLDLDAPITDYLPDLRPENPYGKAVTLRQLMSHRSGLVREPPVGHYFDPSEPSLASVVASLNDTRLVLEPETRTKYSNAAIAVVGYVLEATQGRPFAELLRESLLDPLALRDSDFVRSSRVSSDVASGTMWTYDGRTFPAPTFELGMAPAGSLYSSVSDLGRFLSALLARGAPIEESTLDRMLAPQFAAPGESGGFGLGFSLDTLDGRRRIGHGGAIYGFSTELAFLPEDKLGVVVVTTLDFANEVTGRIADFALRSLLAARQGEALPVAELSQELEPGSAQALAGRYVSEQGAVELVARDQGLWLRGDRYRARIRRRESRLILDDRHVSGTEIEPLSDGRLRVGQRLFERVETTPPDPPPARWRGLIGEYGWDHNVLYVFEERGELHALVEWLEDNRLLELGEDRFALAEAGVLYAGEELSFERNSEGTALRARLGEVSFERRHLGAGSGETFRIDPVRPVEELRAEASRAQPPEEAGDHLPADLVEPISLDHTLRLDVRYASTNNFMSSVFYREPRAFLQRPAAEALVRAHRRLAEHGYGLLIFDAYRPWYVTKMFWEATPEHQKIFVADPASGSRHNRGAAVDLTLFHLTTGEPVEMVGGYDEMTPRSFADYPGGSDRQRFCRELLREVMESEGFEVYEWEWWHFDYSDWRSYPLLNLTFEELEQ